MSPSGIRRARMATVLLTVFLTALVVLADSGQARPLFRWVDRVPLGDKAGHFLLFGLLSFLLNLLWRGERMVWPVLKPLKGSAIVGIVVVLEECSQLFFRSRTFDWLDLGADFAGIVLFGALACVYLRSLRRRAAERARSAEAALQ